MTALPPVGSRVRITWQPPLYGRSGLQPGTGRVVAHRPDSVTWGDRTLTWDLLVICDDPDWARLWPTGVLVMADEVEVLAEPRQETAP